jgi:hypothetical protein
VVVCSGAAFVCLRRKKSFFPLLLNNINFEDIRGTINSTKITKEWSIPEPNEEAQKLLPQVAHGKTNRAVLALELPYAVALQTSTSTHQSKSWFTLAADVAVEVCIIT